MIAFRRRDWHNKIANSLIELMRMEDPAHALRRGWANIQMLGIESPSNCPMKMVSGQTDAAWYISIYVCAKDNGS